MVSVNQDMDLQQFHFRYTQQQLLLAQQQGPHSAIAGEGANSRSSDDATSPFKPYGQHFAKQPAAPALVHPVPATGMVGMLGVGAPHTTTSFGYNMGYGTGMASGSGTANVTSSISAGGYGGVAPAHASGDGSILGSGNAFPEGWIRQMHMVASTAMGALDDPRKRAAPPPPSRSRPGGPASPGPSAPGAPLLSPPGGPPRKVAKGPLVLM